MMICSKKKKKPIQAKRHFQLLEVMIAVLLLMLCAAPALEIFTRMYKEQRAVVRINERDHLVRLIHAKIVERMYKRAIPLEDVTAEGVAYSFSDYELDPQLRQWGYEGSYRFTILFKYTPRSAEKPTKYLIAMTIQMKDLLNGTPDVMYTYEMYVDAGYKDRSNKEGDEGDGETIEGDEGTEVSLNAIQKKGKGTKRNTPSTNQKAKKAARKANTKS